MKPKGFKNIITIEELNAAQRNATSGETTKKTSVEAGRRTASLPIVEEKRDRFDMVLKGLGATVFAIGISGSMATFNHLSKEAEIERVKQEKIERAEKARIREELKLNNPGLKEAEGTPGNEEEILVNQSDSPNVYK